MSGTSNVRHGWNQLVPVGTNQTIQGLTIDGNSANWSWARWYHTAAIQTYSNGPSCNILNCQVTNQYGDGVLFAGTTSTLAFCQLTNIYGRGMIFAGNAGAASNVKTKVLYNNFTNTNLDITVGAGDGLGAIDFSQGGPSVLIHGNVIDGSVDGVGALVSYNGSEVVISANEFWEL